MPELTPTHVCIHWHIIPGATTYVNTCLRTQAYNFYLLQDISITTTTITTTTSMRKKFHSDCAGIASILPAVETPIPLPGIFPRPTKKSRRRERDFHRQRMKLHQQQRKLHRQQRKLHRRRRKLHRRRMKLHQWLRKRIRPQPPVRLSTKSSVIVAPADVTSTKDKVMSTEYEVTSTEYLVTSTEH